MRDVRFERNSVTFENISPCVENISHTQSFRQLVRTHNVRMLVQRCKHAWQRVLLIVTTYSEFLHVRQPLSEKRRGVLFALCRLQQASPGETLSQIVRQSIGLREIINVGVREVGLR